MPPLAQLEGPDLLRFVREAGGLRAASRLTGVPRSTLTRRYRHALRLAHDAPTHTTPKPLPPSDISDEEWLRQRKKRYKLLQAHEKAQEWQPISIPCDGPYALLLLGDQHIDDDRCDWGAIEALSELQQRNLGRMWAVGMGDITNNWSGRMARLWAEQSTSGEDARRATRIFLQKFVWSVILLGNHDAWPGPVSPEWLTANNPPFCVMRDWEAKLVFRSPNGYRFRVWFAHDFKGDSIWNPLHGPLRASRLEDDADLYAAGHHHTAGTMQVENPARGTCPILLRVRGFKGSGSYERRNQYANFDYGSAAVVVVNPNAKPGYGRASAFLDPWAGEAHLHSLLHPSVTRNG